MTDQETPRGVLTRVPTGVRGLDEVLQGGLFRGGIYIIRGNPGAGKTILGNQLCFEAVRQGHRAMFVTLLAESHARMLAQMRILGFFDERFVGNELKYVNAYGSTEAEGLAGLLRLLRDAVRTQKADLLILDGVLTLSALASSTTSYKKFINELQTWIGLLGCTVVFLASGTSHETTAEHTMVDGIFELSVSHERGRMIRRLTIHKFRGSHFIEGAHTYEITDVGVTVHPRFEAVPKHRGPAPASKKKLATGIAALDKILAGGLSDSSSTLILGSSGSGKTLLGLQMLAGGYLKGESTLMFTFFEGADAIADKGDRLGLQTSKALKNGKLTILRRALSERPMDALAAELLTAVEETKCTRLFIDGLVGFKYLPDIERMPTFFSALSNELARRGVTLFISEETRELFIRDIEIPTGGASAIFQNILFLRQVESEATLTRLLSVMKTRDSGFDSRLYEFAIEDGGIRIGKPFQQAGALLGLPASTGRGRSRKLLRRK